jgi:hypothetical protein
MGKSKKPMHGDDYYLEDGKVVFTPEYHLKRGECCGNKCRHCPYDPSHKKGATKKKDFSGERD